MLINDINTAIKTNKGRPIIIRASNILIYDVFGARKYPGGQTGSIESHTDIILDKRTGKNTNISLKEGPLSSLTKGNIRGLEAIIPGITRRFMHTAFTKLKQMNIQDDDTVPEVFGKLQESDKEKLFIGKTSTGGPIDYVYIGKETTQYDEEEEILSFDGQLIDPKSYVKKRTFYLKLVPLYDDQGFDSQTMFGGVPKIYGKSKDRKISESTIILTEDISDSAVVVEIA